MYFGSLRFNSLLVSFINKLLKESGIFLDKVYISVKYEISLSSWAIF
jgi:hypothetical protein